MADITDLFDDPKIVKKIKKKLPYLFTIAEAEASRGGNWNGDRLCSGTCDNCITEILFWQEKHI